MKKLVFVLVLNVLFLTSQTGFAEDFWIPFDEAYHDLEKEDLYYYNRVLDESFDLFQAVRNTASHLENLGYVESSELKDLRETATGLRARHTDDWFFYQYQGDGSFLFWNEQYFRRNAGQEEDRFERNRDKVIRATESHLEQIIREFDLKQDLREFSWGNVQAMDSGSQDEKGDLLDLYTEAYSATFQRSLEGVQVLGVGSGGSITIRPSGQVVGVTADFATYQNSGERSDLVELNVARDRVKGLFKALNLNAAELTGVRCGYYDFGARIGYGEGELPLACSLAIRIDENGGAVMLHVPISEEIPDMTIFTEAQHLRGEYDEPEGDAPGDEK